MDSNPASADQPEAPHQDDRRTVAIEFGVLLFAVWLPMVVSGIHSYFVHNQLPPRTLYSDIFGVLSRLGETGLILLAIGRSRSTFRRFGIRTLRQVEIPTASFVYVLNLILMGMLGTILLPLRSREGAHTGYQIHSSLPAYSMLVLYLVSATFEEIFHRGYVLTRLLDLGTSKILAVLISAALFALPHIYQGWLSLPTIFLLGIVFAIAFLQSRSVGPLILAHAAYNFTLYAMHG